MPPRHNGFTPTDANSYPPLTDRAFRNPFRGDTNGAAEIVTDEAFQVPTDTYMWSLLNTIHGNPTLSTVLSVRTAPSGGGTLLTATETLGVLSAGQVRVLRGTGWLEFHSSKAGAWMYATYYTTYSNWDAATMAWLWAAQRRADNVNNEVFVAGEAVTPGPGYIQSAQVYKADVSDITKSGWVWIDGTGNAGDVVTCRMKGKVFVNRTMPVNTPILAGRNHDVTWWDDVDDACRLQKGDAVHVLGVSFNGYELRLDIQPTLSRWME